MNETTHTRDESSSNQQRQVPKSPENELGCLLRVYWMILGNALLAAAAYKIVQTEGELTFVDLFYWLLVGSLITVRYVDIRFLLGRTSEGQPATMKDWRRYTLEVLAISATLWLAAHGLSYFGQ
jgi:hypothetical protein